MRVLQCSSMPMSALSWRTHCGASVCVIQKSLLVRSLWVYKSLFLGYESKCALSLLWICGLLFSHLQAFGQRQRICKFLFPVLFRALLSSSTLTRSSVYCEKLWIYIVWLSNSLLPSRADVQAVLGFLWKFHSRFPSSVISGCPLLSQ